MNFTLFENLRSFTDEERIAYNNMLERLSVETGINILDYY